MNASQIIYEKLSALVDGRCYPLFVPEYSSQKPPYIIYQQISTEPENTLDGVTGHEWITMQIDIYHNDYDECLYLTTKTITKLNQINPSIYQGVQHFYDKESGLFRSLLEYGFWQALEI